MRRIRLFLAAAIVLACSIIFIGCVDTGTKAASAAVNEQTTADGATAPKLTLDEIKGKYADRDIKNIQSIGKEWVLVESQQKTFANRFDLYNLITGDMDTLPTMPEFVTLEKAESENYFIFLASGRNSECVFGNFPYRINCVRIKSELNKDDDFIALYEDKYFSLDYSVQSGSKEYDVMSDIVITLDGFQVLFGPIEGDDLGFYAAATDIPPTHTSYDKDKKQMTFEIGTAQLGKKLKAGKKVNTEVNQYISAYEIKQEGSKILLIADIKDVTTEYTMKSRRLPDQLPYFSVSFRGEQ